MNNLEFEEIYKEYSSDILNYISKKCKNKNIAQDILHDVFSKIWEKKDSIYTSQIKSLLYKIANDIVISEYRKNVIQNEFEKSIYSNSYDTIYIDERIDCTNLKRDYTNALKKMPENIKTTFLLNRRDNLKYKEIAELLGISIKTVEKRMTLALTFLRKTIL
ncbi:MAG: sigma-70 family RNA polymerase sigma factor [Bacteroidetes bacterium]|nr:sigma-70 family RNA polymerase sigma factor [Bacteroidota bacterium]